MPGQPGPRPSTQAPIVVASNRGPLSFVTGEDGRTTLRHAAGGLVSGLSGAVEGDALLWVCPRTRQ